MFVVRGLADCVSVVHVIPLLSSIANPVLPPGVRFTPADSRYLDFTFEAWASELRRQMYVVVPYIAWFRVCTNKNRY